MKVYGAIPQTPILGSLHAAPVGRVPGPARALDGPDKLHCD